MGEKTDLYIPDYMIFLFDHYMDDLMEVLPSMINDFEQYLREQEEENPTQLSRLVEIENELD